MSNNHKWVCKQSTLSQVNEGRDEKSPLYVDNARVN